jgi:tetratricopeptide (TPR) repeat protein
MVNIKNKKLNLLKIVVFLCFIFIFLYLGRIKSIFNGFVLADERKNQEVDVLGQEAGRYLENGEFAKAIPLLKEAIQNDSSIRSAKYLANLAAAYYGMGNYNEAELAGLRAIKVSDQEPTANAVLNRMVVRFEIR